MEWIKFTEQLPPYNGTEILIAMRNKNMGDDGIWLYDVCYYVGGDITDNDNWEGKFIFIASYTGKEKIKDVSHYWWYTDDGFDIDGITHWQKIVLPKKEE